MNFLIPLLAGYFLATSAFAASFPDTARYRFDEEIGRLKEVGAVSGYADGTFRPNAPINRAEFVKILLEYTGKVQGTGPSACFTDFNEGGFETAEWYYAYACEAKTLGYIQGYPDGSFGGEKNINLAEALKIVMAASETPLPQYIQAPDPWYDPYFIAAENFHLGISMEDPSHLVTRGEMAHLIVRINHGPAPTSTSESHFLLHEIYYDCSQPIKGEWVEARIGPMGAAGYYFQPADQEEFKKYCREGAIIEYRAVLDILSRDDVKKTIAKYSTVEAWVRALGHKYINDKDYLKRILPAYSDVKIDCIIVVHSPEGTRFFIENGEKHESHADHQYMEVPAKEFLTSLNNAPDEDVTNFWLGLH